MLCYYCDCYAFSGLILYESSQASNEVGANYSAYRIRSFVGVLTQHLMEPNKYASWTLLLGLWAPGIVYQKFTKNVVIGQFKR